MALPTDILLTYGYLLLFVWVLVEQLGIPLPATPVILAAGALSAGGPINFFIALAIGAVAALIADTVWFLVGRSHGHHVLRLLCKLSLEPTTCVRRTQDSFGRRRGVMLIFAKFVPGLATLAPPVAGQNGMGFGPFLFFDGIGAMLWVGALLAAGRFFDDLLKRNAGLLHWAGRFSGALLLLGIVAFFLVRIYRRRAVLKKLAAARLEPADLKRQLDAGEPVFIVDLRHPLELVPEPFTLPGAQHFSPDALAARHNEIPRDRDIVLYCTCPSEATAAKTAMTLLKLGIERVRPLRGGYDEWKRLGFPMDAIPPVNPLVTAVQAAN
jgi:membrane protein DedA with SNARE-associated domain/rhodanese-related sulfurtransferase